MIDVTCAIIRNEDDEILVVQRGEATDHPFKWEFPGGKLKDGESPEDCIIREITEELSIDIIIFKKLNDVEYDYGIKEVRLIPFICDTLENIPFLSEHIAYKWIKTNELSDIDFSEADIIVAKDYVNAIADKKRTSEPEVPVDDLNDAEIKDFIDRIHSSKEAEWLAASVNENQALLRKLIQLSYSEDQKLAFHSSWILNKACEKYPDLINNNMPRIIESLPVIINESALRSFLRIISLSDPAKLSPKHQGLLADVCFMQLNSGSSAIAIKAYSMEILYKLTILYPELATELAVSVRSIMDIDSAGVVSKARSILKKLDKQE